MKRCTIYVIIMQEEWLILNRLQKSYGGSKKKNVLNCLVIHMYIIIFFCVEIRVRDFDILLSKISAYAHIPNE